MKKLAILFFGVFALSTTAVQAAFYDFTTPIDIVYGAAGYSVPGITVTAGTSAGDNDLNIVRDSADNNGIEGGLGVVQGDDNQEEGEYVNVVFDSKRPQISLNIIGDHKDVTNGSWLHYSVNGDAEVAGTALNISHANMWDFALILSEEVSSLSWWVTNDFNDKQKIYVTSLTAVPVPAAVWLFGTAMLGLFGLRRKAKMGAVTA